MECAVFMIGTVKIHVNKGACVVSPSTANLGEDSTLPAQANLSQVSKR